MVVGGLYRQRGFLKILDNSDQYGGGESTAASAAPRGICCPKVVTRGDRRPVGKTSYTKSTRPRMSGARVMQWQTARILDVVIANTILSTPSVKLVFAQHRPRALCLSTVHVHFPLGSRVLEQTSILDTPTNTGRVVSVISASFMSTFNCVNGEFFPSRCSRREENKDQEMVATTRRLSKRKEEISMSTLVCLCKTKQTRQAGDEADKRS